MCYSYTRYYMYVYTVCMYTVHVLCRTKCLHLHVYATIFIAACISTWYMYFINFYFIYYNYVLLIMSSLTRYLSLVIWAQFLEYRIIFRSVSTYYPPFVIRIIGGILREVTLIGEGI